LEAKVYNKELKKVYTCSRTPLYGWYLAMETSNPTYPRPPARIPHFLLYMAITCSCWHILELTYCGNRLFL